MRRDCLCSDWLYNLPCFSVRRVIAGLKDAFSCWSLFFFFLGYGLFLMYPAIVSLANIWCERVKSVFVMLWQHSLFDKKFKVSLYSSYSSMMSIFLFPHKKKTIFVIQTYDKDAPVTWHLPPAKVFHEKKKTI